MWSIACSFHEFRRLVLEVWGICLIIPAPLWISTLLFFIKFHRDSRRLHKGVFFYCPILQDLLPYCTRMTQDFVNIRILTPEAHFADFPLLPSTMVLLSAGYIWLIFKNIATLKQAVWYASNGKGLTLAKTKQNKPLICCFWGFFSFFFFLFKYHVSG